MKAQIKSDFEKHLISIMQKDATGYYFTLDGKKVYLWFEGQEIKPTDYYMTLKIVPIETETVATNIIYHGGFYRFYVYAKASVLTCDKIADGLSNILNEQTVDIAGSFRIELDILKTYQRGNKFAGCEHWENIHNINFRHWEKTT